MRKFMTVAAVLMLPTLALADTLPQPITDFIAESRKSCEQGGKMKFAYDTTEVVRKDVFGRDKDDYLYNNDNFTCDGSVSYFQGNAGPTWIIASNIDGKMRAVFQTTAHRLDIRGNGIIVATYHGSACGLIGAEACVKQHKWVGSKFVLDKVLEGGKVQKNNASSGGSEVGNGTPEIVSLKSIDGLRVDHNGSSMIVDTSKGLIVYEFPKASIRKAVKPGQVLFRGKIDSDIVSNGIAYVFKEGCAPAPYTVSGRWIERGYVLKGAAPIRDKNSCAILGTTTTGGNAVLKFEEMGDY